MKILKIPDQTMSQELMKAFLRRLLRLCSKYVPVGIMEETLKDFNIKYDIAPNFSEYLEEV